MSYNQSGTFIYAPDIKCGIMTQTGFIDISDDIIDFNITRQISAVSQANLTLSNVGFKYNRVINTMDRITIFLKRVDWVQMFTGYITFAPIETLVPTPVNIAADCTLRILQNTFWDDTLITFQQLLLNYMDGKALSSNQTLNDGGISQAITNILVDVCKWNPNNIHIGEISSDFMNLAVTAYNNSISISGYNMALPQDAIQEINSLLGAGNYQSIWQTEHTVPGGGANGTTVVDYNNAPAGTRLSIHYVKPYVTTPTLRAQANDSGQVTQFWAYPQYQPGLSNNDPVGNPYVVMQDPYWCAVPFPYLTMTPKKRLANGEPDPTDPIEIAKTWIRHNQSHNSWDGRLINLINPENGNVVNVRATCVTRIPNRYASNGDAVTVPKQDVHNIDYFQVSPAVMAYLAGAVTDPSSWNPRTTPLNQLPSQLRIIGGWANYAQTVGVPSGGGIDTGIVNNSDAVLVNSTLNAVINYANSQIHKPYIWGGGHSYNPKVTPAGFDCIGLIEWAYNNAGIKIPGGTTSDAFKNDKYGSFIPPSQQQQVGDLMLWNVDGESPEPAHATMLVSGFQTFGPNQGYGTMIQAEYPLWGKDSHGKPVYNGPDGWVQWTNVKWDDIKGGKNWRGWGMKYVGARRPITLMPQYAGYQQVNITAATASGNSWNTIWNQPQYDVRSAGTVGSERAFLLDNNVMSDMQQIVSAGLRDFMSAPNGDFVCWFPDYWGVYGTDPVLDISPVEIIDFQIYHDDNQLVTHYGVIGDTTGIGQQVSSQDYMTTNGIVSIADSATMKILFGSVNPSDLTTPSNSFLSKYGLRPMKVEQNMIHSHALEYFFGLKGFMEQWGNQFTSTVLLTFMPELYPGMRITIKLDENNVYQFYCTAVTHQGSRSGGFTTQATLTAPMKNNRMLSYGIEFAQ